MYGPDDHREIDKQPVDISEVPTHGKGYRPCCKHLRCGCICHFSICILKKAPKRCLITYSEMNHIDNQDEPCHGQEVVDFVGTRAYHAPHISK